MSTKISLDLFFLLSSFPIGFVIARDETVFEENIFGVNFDTVEGFF
jgi:hypothetical protein